MDAQTVTLEDLNGAVQYNLAAGGVGEAVIVTRTYFSRREDMHYPHSYRVACNTAGWTVSFTQASIDRGDVWPHPESGVSSRILRAYHIARAAGAPR